MADAAEIEAQAKRRLADEYDAAQERGEVAGPQGGGERSGRERSPTTATVSDLGLTRKQVHEARQIRNAEAASPGVIRRTLDARLAEGQEPTKAAVRAIAGYITENTQLLKTEVIGLTCSELGQYGVIKWIISFPDKLLISTHSNLEI